MRDTINSAVKTAMKAKDSARLGTLRLINAAIKDRDIDARSDGNFDGVDDAEILSILAKMVKQRQESATVYEEGGRVELAERERSEIKVIEEFMPRQMDDAEIQKAVDRAVADVKAESIRDMGKVMGALKSAYAGQMDFGKAGALVKATLG